MVENGEAVATSESGEKVMALNGIRYALKSDSKEQRSSIIDVNAWRRRS